MLGVCLNEWVSLYTARVTEWLTVALRGAFWISTRVVAMVFGCYMAGAAWNCCRLGARSVCTTQPCSGLQCHLIRSRISRAYVCLAVICHLHFSLAEWPGYFTCYCGNTEVWNGYWKKVSTTDPGKGNIYRHSCRDWNARVIFSRTSWTVFSVNLCLLNHTICAC